MLFIDLGPATNFDIKPVKSNQDFLMINLTCSLPVLLTGREYVFATATSLACSTRYIGHASKGHWGESARANQVVSRKNESRDDKKKQQELLRGYR